MNRIVKTVEKRPFPVLKRGFNLIFYRTHAQAINGTRVAQHVQGGAASRVEGTALSSTQDWAQGQQGRRRRALARGVVPQGKTAHSHRLRDRGVALQRAAGYSCIDARHFGDKSQGRLSQDGGAQVAVPPCQKRGRVPRDGLPCLRSRWARDFRINDGWRAWECDSNAARVR